MLVYNAGMLLRHINCNDVAKSSSHFECLYYDKIITKDSVQTNNGKEK